mmetsp:Transcript_13077/g.30887  ORF Transcript_13077/g.30887 Transcript_13077/m.30887 type:complete len:122 (-) Transcript_13077:18-383(-)
MTGGRGVDIALEAVGSNSALRLAYDIIRPGGVISSIGVNTDTSLPFTPADCYDKNITFKTGRCPARRVMDIIADKAELKERADSVITHCLDLADAVRGYDIFSNRREGCVKLIFQTSAATK